jgi:carbon-monoxide dehydrogenase large subunit
MRDSNGRSDFGLSRRRLEASGYLADRHPRGALEVAFVRSPYPHAALGTIRGAGLTAADLEVEDLTVEGLGLSPRPWPALARDRVRFVGEPVAAVVAESAAIAEDATADVVVDWEPLAAVTDPFEAMKPGAPLLHESAAGNIEHKNQIKAGDPDAVFARARRVVKQRMNSQRLCGVPMEPRACLAAPDGTTGGIVVWSSHQAPHGQRADLATTLGVAQNMVRVVVPEMGGGFGVKFGCHLEDVVCAVIARVHRLPVRWVESRVEAMMADARPCPGGGARGRRGRRRSHRRLPHERGRGYRRLSGLHVHPGPHPHDGRRRLPDRAR